MPDATIKLETPPCLMCMQTSFLTVNLVEFARWRNGEHIQFAFPNMSADDRELLLTGTHPTCWNEMWADDDA